MPSRGRSRQQSITSSHVEVSRTLMSVGDPGLPKCARQIQISPSKIFSIKTAGFFSIPLYLPALAMRQLFIPNAGSRFYLDSLKIALIPLLKESVLHRRHLSEAKAWEKAL